MEYLTFVAAHGKGGVEVVYADEDIWLSQKMIAVLYDVKTHTINYHLKKIFADNELTEEAVIRKFRITASDGKSYETAHYNLSAIIAVGYKVNSERAVQFRKWTDTIYRLIAHFMARLAATSRKLFRPASMLSMISSARTSGSGRLSRSARLLSLSQNISRLVLSRAMSSL